MLIESLGIIIYVTYTLLLFSILWPYYVTPAKSLDIIIRSSIRVLHRVQLHDHESVNYHLVNYKWLTISQRSTFSYLKLILTLIYY